MSIKPISITSSITSQGAIKASAGYLVWINVHNSTGNPLYCTLNNATSGTGSEILRIGVPADDSKFRHFGADFFFGTGIWIGVIETGLYVTAGYR